MLDEFTILVWKMREAQREYFSRKSQEALEKARTLESQVDAEIKRRVNEVEQPRLF